MVAKKPTKWMLHVKATAKKPALKGKPLKDVLKQAKKTYK